MLQKECEKKIFFNDTPTLGNYSVIQIVDKQSIKIIYQELK